MKARLAGLFCRIGRLTQINQTGLSMARKAQAAKASDEAHRSSPCAMNWTATAHQRHSTLFAEFGSRIKSDLRAELAAVDGMLAIA